MKDIITLIITAFSVMAEEAGVRMAELDKPKISKVREAIPDGVEITNDDFKEAWAYVQKDIADTAKRVAEVEELAENDSMPIDGVDQPTDNEEEPEEPKTEGAKVFLKHNVRSGGKLYKAGTHLADLPESVIGDIPKHYLAG